MNTVIFRTIAPVIVVVMVVFSIFVLLRGHNEPGGGFIGGLIAAAAITLFAMAAGVRHVRWAMVVDPASVAACGVLLAGAAGLLSLFVEAPFLTGLWASLHVGETEVAVSTPMLFDIGVYLTVFGTISAVVLALADDEEEAP